jgi:hypothetical protein
MQCYSHSLVFEATVTIDGKEYRMQTNFNLCTKPSVDREVIDLQIDHCKERLITHMKREGVLA